MLISSFDYILLYVELSLVGLALDVYD